DLRKPARHGSPLRQPDAPSVVRGAAKTPVHYQRTRQTTENLQHSTHFTRKNSSATHDQTGRYELEFTSEMRYAFAINAASDYKTQSRWPDSTELRMGF